MPEIDLYLRKSTRDRDGLHALTFRAQEARGREWADANGYTVTTTPTATAADGSGTKRRVVAVGLGSGLGEVAEGVCERTGRRYLTMAAA
jgi:hypothetical protein